MLSCGLAHTQHYLLTYPRPICSSVLLLQQCVAKSGEHGLKLGLVVGSVRFQHLRCLQLRSPQILLTLQITCSTALPVRLCASVAACSSSECDRACLRPQAQQKKAGGLPDPKKREGPVKTAQDIYEEGGVKV